MNVNVVKVLEDRDFNYVKQICDKHENWDLAYDKKKTRVWTKPMPNSDLHMIKVFQAVFV